MKWFNNLSLRNKLILGFGLMLVCLAGVIGAAYLGLSAIGRDQQALTEVEFPLSLELVKIRTMLNRERIALMGIIDAATPKERDTWSRDLREIDEEVDERMKAVDALKLRDPQILKEWGRFGEIRQKYEDSRDKQTLPLLAEGKFDEAKSAILGLQYQQYEKMREQVQKLSSLSEANDRQLVRQMKETTALSYFVFLLVGILAFILAVAVILLLLQTTARPLQQLSGQVERVAYGDLSVDITPEHRDDEVGTLTLAFGMMVGSLRSVTEEVRETVFALSDQAEILKEMLTPGFLDNADNVKKAEETAEKLDQLGRQLKEVLEEYKL